MRLHGSRRIGPQLKATLGGLESIVLLERAAVLTVLCNLSCLPTVQLFHHAPEMAATKAEEFAQIAFVQMNHELAYVLLAPATKESFTREQMVEALAQMHPKRLPIEPKAVEYEPILGQAAMSIYLNGHRDDEEFYYRLVMHGTTDTGYQVGGFFRGSGPYPPSKLRKLLKPGPTKTTGEPRATQAVRMFWVLDGSGLAMLTCPRY